MADGATNVAPAGASSLPLPVLVPREVSQAKLDEELAQWHANSEVYRRRGWLLLSARNLEVEVAFVGSISLGQSQLPSITAAIRLTYENYDLWPPSLTFIDVRTGESTYPVARALDRGDGGDVRDVLLDHPTGRPFLCLPGLREYHSHPQHTGDNWLLHRTSGAGRIAVICDSVWRRMSRNVIGLAVQVNSLPPGHGIQVLMAVTQGEFDPVATTPVGP